MIVDYPILRPGMCFMCEQNNPGKYIDTQRIFEIGVITRLSGRKYICSGCVQTFADELGYATPDRLWSLEEMLSDAQNTLKELREENERLESLVQNIDWFQSKQDNKESVTNGPNSNRGRKRSNGGS